MGDQREEGEGEGQKRVKKKKGTQKEGEGNAFHDCTVDTSDASLPLAL
jgi:hypothetical protein